MTETALDLAHAAMQANPEDDRLRLAFYARLAEAELFVELAAEAEGAQAEPRLYDIDGGRFALAFDREARLAGFAGAAVPYLAISGRVVAGLLAAEGIGLALNLDSERGAALLPPDVMGWLAETVDNAPEEVEDRPSEISPPMGLPEALVAALDGKFAQAAGLARHAYLAKVVYDSGRHGHLVAFTGAVPGAEGSLARAVREALVFSGLDAGELDVTFLRDSDPAAAALARSGLRFDMPDPVEERPVPVAPGSDPSKPPILR